ncbi:ER lumen protein-retaining receptor-like isoform X2 [Daucus carota subsp. sativus]|uniref:ER lumen protein-retaining receptor-like isoform X2 n=1 Tax=Daucus carota subsp. sativus TaxID=79200 RepID=UPI0030829205
MESEEWIVLHWFNTHLREQWRGFCIRSYDKDQDTFRHYFLLLPCFLLALFIHERFTFKEVMWTFSLYLEAIAILPQLVLLQRTRNIDNLTGQYVFLLGCLL